MSSHFKPQFRHASPALLLLCSAFAQADASSGNLDVSATIETGCAISATPMAFGTVVPGIDKDTESVVEVICTSGTSYTLDIDSGANVTSAGGSTSNLYRRQMVSGVNLLPYMLYQEPGRITEIAAPVANTNFVTTQVSDGLAKTYTLYGRVIGTESSTSPPGNYSDTVVITVTF